MSPLTEKTICNPAKDRLLRLRSLLNAKGADWCIITTADPHMSEYISATDQVRKYLTGFTGSAGTLVVSKSRAYLWTDGRYFIQAEIELNGSEIILMKDGQKGVPNVTDFLKENVKEGEVLAFDGKYVSRKFADELISALTKDGAKNIAIKSDFAIDNTVWPDRPEREFKRICMLKDSYAGLSAADKLKALREKLGLIKCDKEPCFIISDLCDIMYLLDIRGADVEYVPVAFSYLLIELNAAVLYIDASALRSEDKNILAGAGVTIKNYHDFYNDLKKISGMNILMDPYSCNMAIYDGLKEKNEIIFLRNHEYITKHIKNDTEISCFRRYHIEDAAAVIKFIHYLKDTVTQNPGSINEYDAKRKLDELRLSNKACSNLSFDTISAYKENAALAHYSAAKEGSKVLFDEGLYLVDSGGHYPSCTTDITRTIVLGEISDYQKKCYTAVLKGNIALSSAIFISSIQPECLDILARKSLWDMGLDYRHGTGHGIGSSLSVHEGPISLRYQVKKDNLIPKLSCGCILSDEPGVYIEGEFGIRLENELLVVPKYENEWGDFYGFEVLTLVPFDKAAIVREDLSAEEIEIIDAYHDRVYNTIAPLLEADDKKWLYDATRPL